MRLEYELVDLIRICPGIQKVRVGPATRSAVATHDIVKPFGLSILIQQQAKLCNAGGASYNSKLWHSRLCV